MQYVTLKEIVKEGDLLVKEARRKTSLVLDQLAFKEVGIRYLGVPLDTQQINNGQGAGQPVNLTPPTKTKARTWDAAEPQRNNMVEALRCTGRRNRLAWLLRSGAGEGSTQALTSESNFTSMPGC